MGKKQARYIKELEEKLEEAIEYYGDDKRCDNKIIGMLEEECKSKTAEIEAAWNIRDKAVSSCKVSERKCATLRDWVDEYAAENKVLTAKLEETMAINNQLNDHIKWMNDNLRRTLVGTWGV